MNEATESVFLCILDNLLQFPESLVLLIEDVLVFLMFYFELNIFEPMFLEQIGYFRGTIDYIAELVDDQELQILNERVLTNATILLPRYSPSFILTHSNYFSI